MTRAIVQELVLFFVPFILFGIFLLLRRRNPFVRQAWEGHVPWLVLAGLLCAIAALIYLGLTAERHTGAYVPTHLEDGRLVPGEFK